MEKVRFSMEVGEVDSHTEKKKSSKVHKLQSHADDFVAAMLSFDCCMWKETLSSFPSYSMSTL